MRDVRDAYDRWAETYDTQPNVTRDLDAELLRDVDWPWAELDVVEIGCGTGKNSGWLAERCQSLVGIDLSEGMLARARERVPTAAFYTADITARWPVENDAADAVLANLVLEHVVDVVPVMVEAARVLRPGGRLRISELHPWRQLRGKVAWYERDGERVDVPATLHSTADYIQAALDAGFTIDRTTDVNVERGPPRLLIVEAGR